MPDSPKATDIAEGASKADASPWLFLLAIAPAIFLIGLINRYGVNVPFADEWVTVPIFQKWHDHQLTFADLYRQHNEHRILLPNLIYLAFAQLTKWNLRAEMFFSVALCAGTSAGMYALLRRTIDGSRRQLCLLWAAANLLIFSPTEADSWLLGFALQMFIPNLALVLTLVVLASPSAWSVKFGGAVLLAAAASFSFGNGLLLWPVVALFLCLRGESKWRIAAWLMAFALVAALYFHGYNRVPHAAPLGGDRLEYPRYFLALLGGALVRAREGQLILGAMVTGTVALLIYSAASVHFVSRGGAALQKAAPWLALGAYAIGSAALAAISRVNWGPEQAIDSRYVIVSHNLYVALVALAVIAVKDLQQRNPFRAASLEWMQTALITSIVVLAVAAFPAGVQEMAGLRRERLVGLGALEFSAVMNTTDEMVRSLRMLPGFVPAPLDYVRTLERLNLLQYRRRQTAVLEEATLQPAMKFGRLETIKQVAPAAFELSGSAVLRQSSEPAPLVALAYRAGDHWAAFAQGEVRELRADVAARLHSRRYLAAGWRTTVSTAGLPADVERVSAWAVDPLREEVHQLAGDFPIRNASSGSGSGDPSPNE
jgi:hypothetical protein